MRLAALVLTAVLASCAPNMGLKVGPSAEITASMPVPALAGTRWEVTAIGGEGTGGGIRFLVAFERASFRANLGCNDMNGEYQMVGNQLLPSMARATERGCVALEPGAPDPMRFEEAGFRVLRRPMEIEMIGELLSLSNRAGSLTLRRLP